MAGMKLRVTTGGEVATGTSAKTILQVNADSDTCLVYRGGTISFDGVTATDAPILVTLRRTTTAGTSTAVVPVQENGAVTYTAQCTAGKDFSAEPTSGDVLEQWEIHPQGGGMVHDLSLAEPIIVGTSGRLAIQVLAGVTVNCVACMKLEE